MGFLLNTLTAFGQYRADKAQAKAQRAIQEYRNKMTDLANAFNQNSITQNTTLARQQSAKKAVYMRRDELSALGAARVAAGAAGVRGNSVNQSILNIQRNAGLLEKQRTDDLEGYFLQEHQQRISSALSAAQNQDLSYIPKPRFGTYMLGAVMKTVDQAAGSMGMNTGYADAVQGTQAKGVSGSPNRSFQRLYNNIDWF